MDKLIKQLIQVTSLGNREVIKNFLNNNEKLIYELNSLLEFELFLPEEASELLNDDSLAIESFTISYDKDHRCFNLYVLFAEILPDQEIYLGYADDMQVIIKPNDEALLKFLIKYRKLSKKSIKKIFTDKNLPKTKYKISNQDIEVYFDKELIFLLEEGDYMLKEYKDSIFMSTLPILLEW